MEHHLHHQCLCCTNAALSSFDFARLQLPELTLLALPVGYRPDEAPPSCLFLSKLLLGIEHPVHSSQEAL